MQVKRLRSFGLVPKNRAMLNAAALGKSLRLLNGTIKSMGTCKRLDVARGNFADAKVISPETQKTSCMPSIFNLIHQRLNSLWSGEANAIAVHKSELNDNNNTKFPIAHLIDAKRALILQTIMQVAAKPWK
jgi:hypothetical protein